MRGGMERARTPAAPDAARWARRLQALDATRRNGPSPRRRCRLAAGRRPQHARVAEMPSLKDLALSRRIPGLRLIAALVRIVPLDVGVNVSAKAWRLIAPFDRRHQRALDNLAIAFPEKTPAGARGDRARHVGEPRPRDGRDHADRPHHRRSRSHRDRRARTSTSRYKDKLGAAIGVSLHMGNWELAIWPFTLAGNNPAAVYRTVKNPYVDQLLREAPQSALSRRPARQGARPARRGRRRRAGSWISCATAAAWASSATCTTARACRCRSSASRQDR